MAFRASRVRFSYPGYDTTARRIWIEVFAMMIALRTLALFSVLSLLAPVALGCSPVLYMPAQFVPREAGVREVRLPAPAAFVLSLVRGGARGSCSDIAFLKIAIPANASTRETAYRFEVLSGDKPAPWHFFGSDPLFGEERKGNMEFVFYWTESAPKPMDILVRITPYSKSGRKGRSSKLRIADRSR
jgi:hypothetical protein